MASVPVAPAEGLAGARVAGRPVAWYAAPAAAFLSVGAGYVHLAYTESHWEDWWAYGLFFLATGIAQLLFAPLILRWPSRPLIAIGIAGNLAIVGMYVWSRTEGIPFGPHTGVVEQAAAPDLATTAGEILLVVLLLLMIGSVARRWILNGLLVTGVALWVIRIAEIQI
jgi:hypothetical protein